MAKIVVIDDERQIADIIKFNLEKEGYEVKTANDGQAGIDLVQSWSPDLAILDIMMPIKDGFEVLKEIRQDYTFPIIMLTAKEEEMDKVLGLELGADDYVVKPFGMKELMARVNANLRRFKQDQQENRLIESEELSIDLDKYEVKKNDEVIELTLREYELLKFLSSNRNQVFSREKLLKEVWGYEYYGDIRTVDVTVRRLREKIEDESADFKYIITKRGVGYYFGGD